MTALVSIEGVPNEADSITITGVGNICRIDIDRGINSPIFIPLPFKVGDIVQGVACPTVDCEQPDVEFLSEQAIHGDMPVPGVYLEGWGCGWCGAEVEPRDYVITEILDPVEIETGSGFEGAYSPDVEVPLKREWNWKLKVRATTQ